MQAECQASHAVVHLVHDVHGQAVKGWWKRVQSECVFGEVGIQIDTFKD